MWFQRKHTVATETENTPNHIPCNSYPSLGDSNAMKPQKNTENLCEYVSALLHKNRFHVQNSWQEASINMWQQPL